MDNAIREIPNRFSMPRRINRLPELAYNLWWVGNPDAQALFLLVDKVLWEKCHHNPVAFLTKIERPRLNAVINDRRYLELFDRVMKDFDNYLTTSDTWFNNNYPQLKDKQLAYFSFEFGLHECLPVYAGGLGILSGDHLKESSDLGLPLVAVGFIYNQGYFTQHITEDGWQETGNYYLNFFQMPIFPIYDAQENPLTVSVDLPGRKVMLRIWEVKVGRISLYLLDTNMEENSQTDRELSSRLYSNDLETRISQEILLGIGGVRALRLLGHNPTAWHMNEGHSAFLILERIRELINTGSSYEEAAAQVRHTSIFTTHTPVPAGNDEFPLWLMDKYFTPFFPQLNLDHDQFIDLGRHTQSWGDSFSMPVLALHLSEKSNAVSELHGQVARKMWNFLWPDCKEDDVPITHITNGVHLGSWLGRRMGGLFDRYMGPNWMEHMDDLDMWEKIENIPDQELWEIRRHLKRKLFMFANERARESWLKGTSLPVQVIASGVMLDSYTLTIGFARRFATYKRGYLILRNFDRLLKLINNPQMPMQIVFAGKAHPADEPGKLIIQQIYRAIKDPRSGGRMVFLEDYDMNVSRLMVQGVDIWMNTPRRPNEASGTSGMKAGINGVLNFSVLDGWWREGYNGNNGWAIGDETDCDDPNQQDDADSDSLYTQLEKEIVPLYYQDRSPDHIPAGWMAKVKESIRTVVPQFCMRRMVKEYMRELYLSAMEDPQKHAL